MIITTDVLGQTTLVRKDKYLSFVAGREKMRLMMQQRDKEEKTEKLEKEIESLESAIKTHKKRVKEHEDKLAQYEKDPDSMDNDGRLKNAPTKEIREKIISGRKKVLQDAMDRHKRFASEKAEKLKATREELKKTKAQ